MQSSRHGPAVQHAGGTSPQIDLRATIVDPLHETVPLSSVPCEALGVQPAEQKAARDVRSCSGASNADSTGTSTISGKTGALSQLLAAEKAKAEEFKLRMNRPRQVTGLPTRYHRALAWAGRIGWVGKAVVYAMIGGLACQASVSDETPDPNLPQTEQISASPQGAFVLLSSTGQVSIAILLVMLVALLAYITWRFWEGLAGQGYDETFSAKKNFFKFRVSPIVSGAVYVSYMVFLITVLDRQVRHVPAMAGPQKEGWPATWRHSTGGRVGLALLGIAFIIATCIQLQGVLTRQWHRDYRGDLPRWLMLTVFTIGHFGFAGRAGAFLALAVLFFKDTGGGEDAPHSSSMVANALQQLQTNRGLRAILMIVGILLITYGLFATLSAFTRMFPTPPPSRRKRLPAAEYKEHKQRKAHRRQHGRHILPRHHDGDHPHSHDHPEATAPARDDVISFDGASQSPGSESYAGPRPLSQSRPKQGWPKHPSPGLAAAPSGPNPSPSHLAPADSAALANATSTASSIPIAVDESPGWGADQGRSRPSLDLDAQHPGASRSSHRPPSRSSGLRIPSGRLRSGSGSRDRAGAASRALGHSWYMLPGQRQQAQGAASAAAAEQPPAGGVEQHGAGRPEPGSPSSILESHSPRERMFVTVDL